MRDQIQYALQSLCDDDMIYYNYGLPFIAGDDYVAATNGHVLAVMPKDSNTIPDKETDKKNPNVFAVINTEKTLKERHQSYSLDMIQEALNRNKFGIQIGDTCVREATARQFVHFCKLVGLSHVGLSEGSSKHSATFVAYWEGKPMFIMISGCLSDEEFEPVVPDSFDAVKDDCTARPSDGEAYYKSCIMADDAAKKEYESGNWPCFEITLCRSIRICVKAHNVEEAKEIAMRFDYDLDFEDTYVESWEDTCRHDAECDFEEYYDEDGKHDFDE